MQDVPTLKQVQMMELVNDSASNGDASDPQERMKDVGPRLLVLATECHVSSHWTCQSQKFSGFLSLRECLAARYAACQFLLWHDMLGLATSIFLDP